VYYSVIHGLSAQWIHVVHLPWVRAAAQKARDRDRTFRIESLGVEGQIWRAMASLLEQKACVTYFGVAADYEPILGKSATVPAALTPCSPIPNP
jgi:hypothetical protein